MDYSLNPSLQQFSVAHIAVELWETKDLREELASFVVLGYDKKKRIIDFYDRKVRANKILREVTRKVANLPLPHCLKTLVTNYLGLVGNQISTTYSQFFSASSGTKPNFDFYLTHLRWTPFGTVDKRKTVESFLNEKCIPVTQRYILAHRYCCGGCDDPDAWQQCSAEMNDFVAHHETLNPDGKLKLSGSWEDKGHDLFILHNAMGINFGYDYDGCFRDRFCVETSGESIAEYRFFSSPNEECCQEIILCAIKEMNSTQRSKFIPANCAFVMEVLLNDLLRWPQFLESVELMKRCSPCEFYTIMAIIAEKGNEDFAHFNDCRYLFQETWIRTPVNLKTYALDIGVDDLIRSLVASEDADSIKLMLNDATDDRLKDRIGYFIQDAFVNTPLYVQKGDFGYITRFLEKILPSVESIAYTQWRILIARKYYFCAKFIAEGKFEMLDKFVNWGAGYYFDPSAFKRNLAYVKGLEICHSWIVSGDYFAIDEFVNWCFSSKKEKTEFKMSILQPEVATSLESGDTEMADIFYNWFFQKSLKCNNGNHSFETVNFAGDYDDIDELSDLDSDDD